MKVSTLTASIVLLTFSTACSSPSSNQDLHKELQTITSWTATAEMVSEAWKQGNVPEAYAQQALEHTQHELEKETQTVNHIAQKPAELPADLDRLTQSLKQIRAAVEQHDRVALTQPLQHLTTTKQKLLTLTQQERI